MQGVADSLLEEILFMKTRSNNPLMMMNGHLRV